MIKIQRCLVMLLTASLLLLTGCQKEVESPDIMKDFLNISPISLEETKNSITSAFHDARLNGKDYLKKEGVVYYLDLSTIPLQMNTISLPKRINLISQEFDYERTRSVDVHSEMIEFGFSDDYTQVVDHILSIIDIIDDLSYEDVKAKFELLYSQVEKSSLTEYEKLSIGQVLILSITILEDTYTHSTSTDMGRTKGCETNWRAVARSAIAGGITLGAKTAWDGAVAGSIATANPFVGGIVGGLAGFTIGFVGGALLGGIGHYVAGQVVCDESINDRKVLSPDICLDQLCRNKAKSGTGLFGSTAITSKISDVHGTIYYNPSLIQLD